MLNQTFNDEKIKSINNKREYVFNDYRNAQIDNEELFKKGLPSATVEYIYPNQKDDAFQITHLFYTKNIRVISIVKRTKVGMDGLMIEIAKNMSTHSDDDFVLDFKNIFFITGMSNVSWETEMKNKIPNCFRENVLHHGKLQQLTKKLNNIKNALIIIDEIDTGDKEDQKLHTILKESKILDIKYMEDNNIRFIFVSATMIKELHELYKWGDKHHGVFMSIPPSYIGHGELLEKGIIKEYYQINNLQNAEKWIKEDIIQHYDKDFRVHIIRSDKTNINYIRDACIKHNIEFKNHTSDDRIDQLDLSNIFNSITKHIVIAVKGFYRRANLIPNDWKIKIGATHERCVIKHDTNVQIQGLTGRMTGYWKDIINNEHKTGPYRTSIKAVKEYEEFYKNPISNIEYHTSNSNTFLAPHNINNLDEINIEKYKRVPIIINIEDDYEIISKYIPEQIEHYIKHKINDIEEYKNLYNFITNSEVKCAQITRTNDEYIKDIKDSLDKNKTYFRCVKENFEEFKNTNNWQLYIDEDGKNLCFILWVINKSFYPLDEINIEKYKRVPIIINIDDDYEILCNFKKKQQIKYIEDKIINKDKYKDLYNFITNPKVKCAQITRPHKESSKNFVEYMKDASIKNKPYVTGVKYQYKNINNWQAYIDEDGKNLCFVLWVINDNFYPLNENLSKNYDKSTPSKSSSKSSSSTKSLTKPQKQLKEDVILCGFPLKKKGETCKNKANSECDGRCKRHFVLVV